MLKLEKKDVISVKFNFMDFMYSKWYKEDGVEKDSQIRISYNEETYFGNYDVAERLLNVKYTNSSECERLKN